jgi:hypothetical protein
MVLEVFEGKMVFSVGSRGISRIFEWWEALARKNGGGFLGIFGEFLECLMRKTGKFLGIFGEFF